MAPSGAEADHRSGEEVRTGGSQEGGAAAGTAVEGGVRVVGVVLPVPGIDLWMFVQLSDAEQLSTLGTPDEDMLPAPRPWRAQ